MTSGIKRTRDEIEKIVNNLGYNLIDEYYSFKIKKVIIKDFLGYKYDVVLTNILRQSKIEKFHKHNPFTLENISLWIKLNNKKIELCKDNIYIGGHKKLRFHCFVCNDIFSATWTDYSHYINDCPICIGQQVGRKTSLNYLLPDLAKELSLENNFTGRDVTLYSNKLAIWVCRVCGYKWKAKICARSIGTGCPACSGNSVSDKNRLSILFPELCLEWHLTKNGNMFPENVSYGSEKNIWWKCLFCGHVWQSIIYNRTKGKGCPKCKESKGEKRISNFFDINNIFYIPQYTFEDCVGKKRLLPFDFYLPEYNILIEYDGTIHFLDKFNSPKEFEEMKKRDTIKTKYCKDNNIPVLRIPYWDFNNIETILQEYLFKENNV